MLKIGRNELCPCGSGEKFKKCHMGREGELALEELEEFTDEMSARVTGLQRVDYGRSKEMVDAIDIKGLTGNTIGIKFVDLQAYNNLNVFGGSHERASKGAEGGIFINIYKTLKTDPDNVYLAISQNIDDSTLIHELAHAIDYLGGSNLMPGTLKPLSLELSVPVDHLEHPEEYGYWLDYLKNMFDVQLDADDSIINYLYKNERLIKSEAIKDKNEVIIKTKSEQIFGFLSENSQDINAMIKALPGYIGERKEEN